MAAWAAAAGLWAGWAEPCRAQSTAASPAVQADLLIGALLDGLGGVSLPPTLRIVVVTGQGVVEPSADELASAFRARGTADGVAVTVQVMAFRGVRGLLERIDRSPVDAIYLHASAARALSSVQQVTRARKVVSMTGTAQLADRGVSLTVIERGEKARLAVDARAARLEGFTPSSALTGAAGDAGAGPTVVGSLADKVAFLTRLPQFVKWPSLEAAGAQAPLVVGVLGDDPFGSALDTAFGRRRAGRRPIEVVRFSQASEARGCHILFISASEHARLEATLGVLGAAGVLTVGDSAGLAERGVVVNLLVRGGRLRFEVNLAAAHRADLKISAKLLSLAKIVP